MAETVHDGEGSVGLEAADGVDVAAGEGDGLVLVVEEEELDEAVEFLFLELPIEADEADRAVLDGDLLAFELLEVGDAGLGDEHPAAVAAIGENGHGEALGRELHGGGEAAIADVDGTGGDGLHALDEAWESL